MSFKKSFFLIPILLSTLINLSYADRPAIITNLEDGFGARALTMGSAYVGIADDANTVTWNPSGLAFITSKELSVMQLNGILDTSEMFVGYTQPLKRFGLGIGIATYDGGKMDVNYTDGTSREVSAEKNTVANISLAVLTGNSLSYGITAKMITAELVERYLATAYAFDIGMLIRTYNDRFSTGISVFNLGTGISYRSNTVESLPTKLRFGIAAKLSDSMTDTFMVCAGAEQSLNSAVEYNFALEYLINDLFSIRAGYISDGFAIGFGINPKAKGNQLDYSWTSANELGEIHRISLTTRFGKGGRYNKGEGYFSKDMPEKAIYHLSKIPKGHPDYAKAQDIIVLAKGKQKKRIEAELAENLKKETEKKQKILAEELRKEEENKKKQIQILLSEQQKGFDKTSKPKISEDIIELPEKRISRVDYDDIVDVNIKNIHEIPIGYYHVLSKLDIPLFACEVKNKSNKEIYIQLTANIGMYTIPEQMTDFVSIKPGKVITVGENMYPIFNPGIIDAVSGKGIPSKLNVRVTLKRVGHKDYNKNVRLLPKETMVWYMNSPYEKNKKLDFRRALVTWITPKDENLDEIWRKIPNNHPDNRLAGPQNRTSPYIGSIVEPEEIRKKIKAAREDIKALYITLQKELTMPYADDTLDYSANPAQTIAYPAHTVEKKTGNCVDITVLVASLIEKMGYESIIIIKPGHALVGWKWPGINKYDALECTMVNPAKFTFKKANREGLKQLKEELKLFGGKLRDLSETSGLKHLIINVRKERQKLEIGD